MKYWNSVLSFWNDCIDFLFIKYKFSIKNSRNQINVLIFFLI